MSSPEEYQTKSDTLVRGVRIGGSYHKDFTLREEVLSDNLDEAGEVIKNFGEGALREEAENVIGLMKNAVAFRRRLVRLGTLNSEELEKLSAKDFISMTSVDYAIMLRTKKGLDDLVKMALNASVEEKVDNGNSKKK